MRPKDLVIRVDGDSEIGYGHLVRSSALAEEWLARGHDITVATTTPDPARSVFQADVEIAEIPTRSDPDPFVAVIDSTAPDVVFIDAYPAGTDYQRAVRGRTPLAVIRDDASNPVCADLLINGNLYATALDYEFEGSSPITLLGTEYLLLRSEIRKRIGDRTPSSGHPDRAIVTMGASDTASLTATVVRAFDGFDLRVDAVVGPGFSDAQESAVTRAADGVSTDVQVTSDPENLAERMAMADMAVCTASSTTYELLALGTPFVCVPVVDNQERLATALQDRDAATVLDRNAEEGCFEDAIREYVTDATLRRKRSELGQSLADGSGTVRVADGVADLTVP